MKDTRHNRGAADRQEVFLAGKGLGWMVVAAAFTAGARSVFVRSGIYVETANVVLPDGGRLTCEDGATIDFNGAALSVKADGNGGVREFTGTISVANGDATVTGSGTTFTNLSPGDWIKVGAVYVEIDSITNDTSLELVSTWKGSGQSGLAYSAQAMFEDVRVEGVRVTGSTVQGVYLRAVINPVLRGVTVDDNGGASVEIRNCFRGEIEQSAIFDGGSDGLYLVSNCGLTVDDCHIYGNAGSGINMQSDGCRISGNTVDGNGSFGILIFATAADNKLNNNTWTNNLFSDYADNGTNNINYDESYHPDIDSQFNSLSGGAPQSSDVLVYEDSAAGYQKKKSLISSLPVPDVVDNFFTTAGQDNI